MAAPHAHAPSGGTPLKLSNNGRLSASSLIFFFIASLLYALFFVYVIFVSWKTGIIHVYLVVDRDHQVHAYGQRASESAVDGGTGLHREALAAAISAWTDAAAARALQAPGSAGAAAGAPRIGSVEFVVVGAEDSFQRRYDADSPGDVTVSFLRARKNPITDIFDDLRRKASLASHTYALFAPLGKVAPAEGYFAALEEQLAAQPLALGSTVLGAGTGAQVHQAGIGFSLGGHDGADVGLPFFLGEGERHWAVRPPPDRCLALAGLRGGGRGRGRCRAGVPHPDGLVIRASLFVREFGRRAVDPSRSPNVFVFLYDLMVHLALGSSRRIEALQCNACQLRAADREAAPGAGDEARPWAGDHSAQALAGRRGPELKAALLAGMASAQPLLYRSPLSSNSGFSSESLVLLEYLWDKFDLYLVDEELVHFGLSHAVLFEKGLPRWFAIVLDRLRRRTGEGAPRPLTSASPAGPALLFELWTPEFYQLGLAQNVSAQVSCGVGRFMFETDSLPDSWLPIINGPQVDAVWVPTAFHVATFVAAGARPGRLATLGQGINTRAYDPQLVAPLQIDRYVSDNALRADACRGSLASYRFKFLSVFEWTDRKGWRELLEAYTRAFGAADDVALLLKATSIPFVPAGTDPQDYLRGRLGALGYLSAASPCFVVIDRWVASEDMPRLYKAADAFVLPSHGEGWGRPYMEAMAMGLPTIATNFSGMTAFMRADNSFLLGYRLARIEDYHGFTPEAYTGHRQAIPDVDQLVALLRQVHGNRTAAARVGAAARATIVGKYTVESIGAEIERMLRAAQKTHCAPGRPRLLDRQ